MHDGDGWGNDEDDDWSGRLAWRPLKPVYAKAAMFPSIEQNTRTFSCSIYLNNGLSKFKKKKYTNPRRPICYSVFETDNSAILYADHVLWPLWQVIVWIIKRSVHKNSKKHTVFSSKLYLVLVLCGAYQYMKFLLWPQYNRRSFWCSHQWQNYI